MICRVPGLGWRESPTWHSCLTDWNAPAHPNGKIQFYGALNLYLLARSDIFSNRLCAALHGLRRDLQISQQFQLLTAVL